MKTEPNNILDAMHQESSKDTTTWNGAISHSSVGLPGTPGAKVLEYWSKAGTYQGRTQEQVNADMESIFHQDDPKLALACIFHLRLISRNPANLGTGHQTGLGRKDEFHKCMSWLVTHHRDLFLANLHLIPVFGCWKDFLSPPLLERQDIRQEVYALVKENLESDDLLRKYLPQIYSPGKMKRSTKTVKLGRHAKGTKVIEVVKERLSTPRAKALSEWGRGLCFYLGITRRDYRKLKTQGTGHIWQQQMSQGRWDELDFNTIPGKALTSLTSHKGKKDKKTALDRHGQVVRLRDWLLNKPVAKFTGYPHDLLLTYQKIAESKDLMADVSRMVINRQFQSLLDTFKEDNSLGNVLCAMDTSGSMSWGCLDAAKKLTPLDVCKAMGLTFSALNLGYFKDTVAMFSDRSTLLKLNGSFCERAAQMEKAPCAMGSTNFQSLILLLMNVRLKHPEIPVEQFPDTILVLSDMQFNPVAGSTMQTNAEAAQKNLASVGLPNVRLIWWHLNGQNTGDFPCTMHDKGMYLISGFDPTNLKTLMGKPASTSTEKSQETPLDGMLNAFSQPIFNLLRYPGGVV